ncbi:MAG: TadE/TadG family type IV pilus assembly protein [Acidimicrobiia bacterium]
MTPEPLRPLPPRTSTWLGRCRCRCRGRGRGEGGQSAVELALVLPLLALLAMALVQVGLVVRDQLLVLHAARDAVREAAVSPERHAIVGAARSATELDADRLQVEIGPRGAPGTTVRVTVRYRAPTTVPLVGRFVHDVELEATASMRVET